MDLLRVKVKQWEVTLDLCLVAGGLVVQEVTALRFTAYQVTVRLLSLDGLHFFFSQNENLSRPYLLSCIKSMI